MIMYCMCEHVTMYYSMCTAAMIIPVTGCNMLGAISCVFLDVLFGVRK